MMLCVRIRVCTCLLVYLMSPIPIDVLMCAFVVCVKGRAGVVLPRRSFRLLLSCVARALVASRSMVICDFIQVVMRFFRLDQAMHWISCLVCLSVCLS